MIIDLSLGQRKWQLRSGRSRSRFTVNLGVAEISRVVEHEIILKDTHVLNKLERGIRKYGFLHPILATRAGSHIVIADGTHRALALQQIKRKDGLSRLYALNMYLHPGEFYRSAWTLVYEKGISNISELQDSKRWSINSTSPLNEKRIDHRLQRGEIIGFLRINGKFYSVTIPPKSRQSALQDVKRLDTLIGTPDSYQSIQEALSSESDLAILTPPLDSYGDLKLLVKNPNLRRTKGSRTMVSLRPMFLPVPIDILSLPPQQSEKRIGELIDSLLDRSEVYVAKPGLSHFDWLGEKWDHHLLIFNREILLRSIRREDHELTKNLLIEVKRV